MKNLKILKNIGIAVIGGIVGGVVFCIIVLIAKFIL